MDVGLKRLKKTTLFILVPETLKFKIILKTNKQKTTPKIDKQTNKNPWPTTKTTTIVHWVEFTETFPEGSDTSVIHQLFNLSFPKYLNSSQRQWRVLVLLWDLYWPCQNWKRHFTNLLIFLDIGRTIPWLFFILKA